MTGYNKNGLFINQIMKVFKAYLYVCSCGI